jgi:hypothetical protein
MNSTTSPPTSALSGLKDTPNLPFIILISMGNSHLFWETKLFQLVLFIFEFLGFISMFVFLMFAYCAALLGTLTNLVCLRNRWLFAAQISRIAV